VHYEEALKHDPAHHASRFHLGMMYHLSGQFDLALEAFKLVVPEDQALLEARGLVYRDMDDHNRALADFNAVIKLEPLEGRHYYNRGVVYHRMGEEHEAITDLTRAVELGCTDAAVLSERGLAWHALGNMSQAVVDFTSAMYADGGKTSYISNRAQCLFEQGLYDRADSDLTRALEISGRDPELLYKRGIARHAQTRYAASIADLKAALQFEPPERRLADIFYHLGICYANLGNHELAVPAYNKAIEHSSPDEPHYVHERAKSLQVIGEHDKALIDFTHVLDMQPTNARAMFRRGFSFKAKGLYEEAAEDFEAAKEFAPDDARLVINYRQVHQVGCITLGPAGHEDSFVRDPLSNGGPQ